MVLTLTIIIYQARRFTAATTKRTTNQRDYSALSQVTPFTLSSLPVLTHFLLPVTEESSSLGTGSASSQRATLSQEAQFYYTGLPSRPRLVGRSSTTPWEGPNRPKVLGTVFRHPIVDVWEDGLFRKLFDHLKSEKVALTSIDVVRISYEGDSFRPVIVWIGVQPDSLSFEDGTKVARSCKEILVQFGITDVDVEIRESVVTPLVRVSPEHRE